MKSGREESRREEAGMKAKKPELSVVIPNYNGERTIAKAIKSAVYAIKKIRGCNYEIIVCDDCSKDDSVKKISELIRKNEENIKLIRNMRNRGAAYSRNLGIKNSSGKVILFFDSDVYLNKGCIEKLIRGINGFDIAFPKVIFENGKSMYPENKKERDYPGISACFLIKRDSLKKLDSPFDEDYRTYCEDSDFFIRCKISGLKANYCEGAVAVHALKEMKDAERRYFLENRNLVYGMIKLRCVLKKAKIPNPFNLRALFKNFICGIFNFRWFDFSHYERGRSAGFRIKLLLSKHERITQKNSLILFFIFSWAVLNGFFMGIKALCSGKWLHA